MGGVRMEQVNSPWGFLPRGWRLSTIDEEKERLTDYVANGSFASLASNVHYKDTEDYAVLIRLVDFNNDFKGPFVYIDEHAYSFLSKSSLSGGEIIISNVGANVGTVFKCPNLPYKMSLAPNAITIKLKGDNDFYYYWFKSKIGQANIQALVTGSAQPKFNKTNFRSMYIPVPPLDVQRRIASILSSLDRKIELNNKINADLEEMTQAIFKNWFVDFEPFKDGKFVDSELGMIPEGWKVGSPYEYVKVVYGAPYKSAKFNDNGEGLPLIRIRDLKDCNPQFYTPEILPQTEYVNMGDIVAGMDAEFVPHIWKGNTGLLNQRVCKLMPQQTSISNLFVLYLMKPELEFVQSYKTGTTVSHLGKADIDKFVVVLPPLKVVEECSKILDSILQRIKNISAESRTLSTLRDTLLPRLMSGELEVPE